MHVHSADCRDLNMPKYRRAAKDYVLQGETVEAAVTEEATALNAQFDRPYALEELFTIFPCCHK